MMKLLNKKTGEIATLDSEHIDSLADFAGKLLIEVGDKEFSYDTLAELNEDWEDYKPTEPLIKDEKIRKAVRAWAEVNRYDKLWVYHDHTAISFYNDDDIDNEITLKTVKKFGLEHLKCYTITELCGEEERAYVSLSN